jgi:hypothetical protein
MKPCFPLLQATHRLVLKTYRQGSGKVKGKRRGAIVRNGARFGLAVSGERGQSHRREDVDGGFRAGALLGALEHLAGALLATATAGGDAQFELQILERGAPLLCMTNDVAIGDSVANTDNHGASQNSEFDDNILNKNGS